MGTKYKGKYKKRKRGKAAQSQRFRRNLERQENYTDIERKEQRVSHCCALGCFEQFKIGSHIGFFKFPTYGIRRDLWVKAVKRMNWSPSSTSVLCGKHFQTGKPSSSAIHPDYVPNIFVVSDSVEKLPSHSNAAQIEESQCIIQDSIKIEDAAFVPVSSFSSADISEGRSSKDPDHPDYVPNLCASKNSVEKHKGHSSTAPTEESQCVIYEKIEIEDVPTDPEVSSPMCTSEGRSSKDPDHPDYVPNLFASKNSVEKHKGHSTTAPTEESQCVIYEKIEIEDMPTDPKVSSPMCISEGAANPSTRAIRTAQCRLTRNESTYHSGTANPSTRAIRTAQCRITRNESTYHSVTEQEKEVSKLKKELLQARMEINVLRSEKDALLKRITYKTTDRILLDARKLNFFTGLNSIKDFDSLTKLLHDVDTTATSIPMSSQLLIVLMRLQLNLKYPDLADRFGTSINVIWKICERVIPQLQLKLKLLLEELSPITVGIQPSAPHCYSNTTTSTVFVKLYKTIQRYTK